MKTTTVQPYLGDGRSLMSTFDIGECNSESFCHKLVKQTMVNTAANLDAYDHSKGP
jgi:hypothetical protein